MASANFINECKNYAYMNRYGKLEFSNPSLELTQSNKIQEFTVDSGCYVDGNVVGSIYVKKLNTNLIDALEDTIENRQFNASVGLTYIEDDENVTEYMNLGSYVVDKPTDEQTNNLTSFVAYDLLMQHLEEKYDSILDYDGGSITIANVYNELCIRLGLTPVTTTFTNSTIAVENNPFVNGESNRTALMSIAKVACAFVDIDYDNNKIDLKWLSSNVDYTFQPSDYSSLEGAKTVYGPINSLVIKSGAVDTENVSQSDSESIAEYGEHQLVISEDYFLYNATKRQEAITAIWNKVNGLTYTECTLTSLTGKPFLKAGNKIRIYTDSENYIDSYVLQHEFTYDGTFKSVIKCPVLTEQQVQTKQDVSLSEKLRQTEIVVNKQDGTITQLVSKTNQLDTRENNNYLKLSGKFDDYVPTSTFVEVQSAVSTLQTDTYSKTQIDLKLTDGSVTKVQTISGTFDANGMTYEKSGAPSKTTINEVGIGTKRTDGSNNYILFAGYVDNNNTQYSAYKGQTLVAAENMLVDNYLVIGTYGRFEDYDNGSGGHGTGAFFVG